jgi:hypothetical protein
MSERYYIFRRWPWYSVHAGTGTRVLFRSLRLKRAREVQAELACAFQDGMHAEFMQNRPSKEVS